MQQEAIEVGKSGGLWRWTGRGHDLLKRNGLQHKKPWKSSTLKRSVFLSVSCWTMSSGTDIFGQDIAHHIKKTFDERKGATWHCIVGRNFGSFVTHGNLLQMEREGRGDADDMTETKHFIYFYLGHCAILLFKTQ
jgi:hypothetical protein